MNVCVIYATRDRPEVLSDVVATMARQTLPPARVIVSCTTLADAGTAGSLPGVEVVLGPPGLAAQRNTALARVRRETDVVVFFDDDFVAHPGWIAAAVSTFAADPGLAGVTGDLVEDDVRGTAVDFARASALLDRVGACDPSWIQGPCSPYGCNMAFRRSFVDGLRFDERLALYGWLEDFDFGAMVAQRGGRIVKVGAARGVHMGSRTGRISGTRLGYAQVVNPLYLNRKGTMRTRDAFDQVVRDVASNLVRAPWPEPHIDRVGRLRGNLRGLVDILRGQFLPERVSVI